jgi:tRNA threonylcarbamoyl adenosine modification protein YeaZ
MLVLAIDTSTPAVTVAVGDVDGVSGVVDAIVERTEVATNRHGELLAPLIEETLRRAATTPSALDAIAVGVGPGPFTGLRVGIVTAKAMADALAVPVYAACSLDVIARPHLVVGEPLAVLSDARRKQVYWAEYDEFGERVLGPDLATAASVAETLSGRVGRLAGPGAALYRDALDEFSIVDADPYPRAGELVAVVADRVRAASPSDDLAPLYLRRPDAQPPGRPKQVTPA